MRSRVNRSTRARFTVTRPKVCGVGPVVAVAVRCAAERALHICPEFVGVLARWQPASYARADNVVLAVRRMFIPPCAPRDDAAHD